MYKPFKSLFNRFYWVTLPGGYSINNPAGFKSNQFTDLASVFSGFLGLAIALAGFLMVFWLAWGIFQYIFAGGDKNALAKARSRIIWSIVGFIIIIIAYTLSEYLKAIFPVRNIAPTQVTVPR